MARPDLLDVPSSIEGWDSYVTTNFQILRDGPMPFKQYNNATALPAAGSYDRCIAMKEITSGLNPGYRPVWSDGTTWRYIPDNTKAYFDAGAVRIGSNPAAAGDVRLSRNLSTRAMNNAESGDFNVVKTTASDQVQVGDQAIDVIVPAGNSTNTGKIGGTIDKQTTAVGNPGTTSEGDLMTTSLGANALNVNQKGVEWKLSGKFAANGNDKKLKIKFGGTTLFDSGVITDNGTRWNAEVRIYRTGSNAQKIAIVVMKGTAIVLNDVLTATETDSNAITLKATGQSPTTGAASDVTQEEQKIDFVS